MLGSGGSILLVPVLVYVVGQDAHQAATASLVIVTIAALAGGIGQAVKDNVCWRHAGLFVAAAVPGILAGTAVGEAVSAEVLLIAFGILMLAAAYATARKQGVDARQGSGAGCPAICFGKEASLAATVGFVTGLLGVGGGFVVVPVLALALGFRMRHAVGTSLAVIALTGVIGAAAHLAAGRSIDADLTIAMTAAMVVGALAGIRLGQHVGEVGIARAFAGLTGAVGAYLIVSSALLGGPPG
jgi:hypothetical protein